VKAQYRIAEGAFGVSSIQVVDLATGEKVIPAPFPNLLRPLTSDQEAAWKVFKAPDPVDFEFTWKFATLSRRQLVFMLKLFIAVGHSRRVNHAILCRELRHAGVMKNRLGM
jgi:hypothetical protein